MRGVPAFAELELIRGKDWETSATRPTFPGNRDHSHVDGHAIATKD